MRRSVAIFLLINVAIVIYLVSSVWTLLSLLVVDGSADAISRAELPGPASSSPTGDRKELIPRIIHQTYVNESIPPHWEEARQSCLALHKDWEYNLWTDKKARDFIAQEYPWFLETFDGYTYPIQRADAIRYFVLAHFGGIYLDLDDGCNRRLDPLLTYPAWLRRTVPTGISNDAMGAVPHHPFFLRVIDALPRYDKHWMLPYITVMGSTGPLFLSIIWRHYNVDLGAELEMERVRVLMPDEYVGNSWSFFTHHLGNSWHQGDVKMILWMRDHWVFLLILGFFIAGVVFFSAWSIYKRFLRYRSTAGAHAFNFTKRIPFLNEAAAEGYELLNRGRPQREHEV
ncbi:hypothetical protein NA57DRAFT_49950 [Rhizodiscina lignyota]|uniref:Mannosyl phosphorylinositol ceramide synthase SUR1 n=1 Tax=Rhizodiscina lignyota TaxID=1504668 RepID=A0A9P4M0T1_9PEZI|nr:hypothetical protein NA57DRAFT_49950 [Rhizodiscina lignyota]